MQPICLFVLLGCGKAFLDMPKAMPQHGKLAAAFSSAIVIADDLYSSNSIKTVDVSRCLECEIFKIFWKLPS